MALPREARAARSSFGRARRRAVILPLPAADGSRAFGEPAPPGAPPAGPATGGLGVVESRVLEEARLDGVRLAAREMAHLLNNDLAVAVGFIELLQAQLDLPPHLRDLLESAVHSLDSAVRHVDAFQNVVRVAVKQTPAGPSLDLERSQAS